VTAVSPGEAVITVTTADGGKKADCTVTVINPENTKDKAGEAAELAGMATNTWNWRGRLEASPA